MFEVMTLKYTFDLEMAARVPVCLQRSIVILSSVSSYFYCFPWFLCVLINTCVYGSVGRWGMCYWARLVCFIRCRSHTVFAFVDLCVCLCWLLHYSSPLTMAADKLGVFTCLPGSGNRGGDSPVPSFMKLVVVVFFFKAIVHMFYIPHTSVSSPIIPHTKLISVHSHSTSSPPSLSLSL